MAVYTITTAGGVTVRIRGTIDGADRIEREFSLLFGERVTVRREGE